MTVQSDTPWAARQREKLERLTGKQEAATAEAPPPTATLTKKKKKKAKKKT